MPKTNPFEVPADVNAEHEWYRTVYLPSNYWRWRRDQYMKLMGYYCERHCGRLGTQIHHLSYKNLFNEQNDDLMLLCRPCHEIMHKWPKAANDNKQMAFLFDALDQKRKAGGDA